MKILTADQVKRLPVGTDIKIVQNSTGRYSLAYIVKSGRKKMLKKPLMDPGGDRGQSGISLREGGR